MSTSLMALGVESPSERLAAVWKTIEDITWIWSNGVKGTFWDEKSVAYNIGAMADTNPDAYQQIKPLYDQALAALIQFRGLYLRTTQAGGPVMTDEVANNLADAGVQLESTMQAVRSEARANNPSTVMIYLKGTIRIVGEMIVEIGRLIAKVGTGLINSIDFFSRYAPYLILGGLILYFVAPRMAMAHAQGRATVKKP